MRRWHGPYRGNDCAVAARRYTKGRPTSGLGGVSLVTRLAVSGIYGEISLLMQSLRFKEAGSTKAEVSDVGGVENGAVFVFFFQSRCWNTAFPAGGQLERAVNLCSTSSYTSRSHMVYPDPTPPTPRGRWAGLRGTTRRPVLRHNRWDRKTGVGGARERTAASVLDG